MNSLKPFIFFFCLSLVMSCSSADTRDAVLEKLVITPQKPQVALNGKIELSASGIRGNGKTAPVSNVTWKVDKNSINIVKLNLESGSITSITGKKLGKFIVYAESNGLKAQASGEVVKPQTSLKAGGK